MPRWIASDQVTATHLKRQFGNTTQSICEPADALRSLLQSRDSIALLPCDSADHALIASIRRSGTPPATFDLQAAQNRREPRQVATGFLGLVDELVWDEEGQEKPRQTWWKKLID